MVLREDVSTSRKWPEVPQGLPCLLCPQLSPPWTSWEWNTKPHRNVAGLSLSLWTYQSLSVNWMKNFGLCDLTPWPLDAVFFCQAILSVHLSVSQHLQPWAPFEKLPPFFFFFYLVVCFPGISYTVSSKSLKARRPQDSASTCLNHHLCSFLWLNSAIYTSLISFKRVPFWSSSFPWLPDPHLMLCPDTLASDIFLRLC